MVWTKNLACVDLTVSFERKRTTVIERNEKMDYFWVRSLIRKMTFVVCIFTSPSCIIWHHNEMTQDCVWLAHNFIEFLTPI